MKKIFIVTFLFIAFVLACSSKTGSLSVANQGGDKTATIDSNYGVVTGRLFLSRSGAKTPVKDQILYLAEVINDDKNNPSFAAFDRINSPRAVTNANGEFEFINVRPGNYGLVLDVITSSYLLAKPGTQEPMILKILGGNNLDLGDLTYDELPITINE